MSAPLGKPPVVSARVDLGWPVASMSAVWPVCILLLLIPVGLGTSVHPLLLVGVGALVLGVWLAIRMRGQGARERELASYPFEVDDAFSWLSARVPLIDLYLAAPVDRQALAARVETVVPGTTMVWLSDTVVRLAIPVRGRRLWPRLAQEPLTPVPVITDLRAFLDRVAMPLHREVGVRGVDCGGLPLD